MSKSFRKVHQNIVGVTVRPMFGLNYSVPASALEDNELTLSFNGYYPPQSRRWATRPGSALATNLANKLGGPIRKVHVHYNGTTTYLIAAANGKLYHMAASLLDGAISGRVWTEIGNLTDSTVVPQMLTFNTKLLIADGSPSGLRYWNSGGTYGFVTDSPDNPTAIATIKNRVVCNSEAAGGLDGVYFSGTEDETDWDTVSGGAVTIRAGFKDGLSVNGFAVFPSGNDLIVSKRSDDARALYRINVSDATPSNWQAPKLNSSFAFQNANAALPLGNDVVYADDTGFRSIVGVQEYGDLQSSEWGRKINSLFYDTQELDVQGVEYLPLLNAAVIMFKDSLQQYLYTPFNDAWTQWRLGSQATSWFTYNGRTYFSDSSGYLNVLDEDLDDDETSPGVTEDYVSYARTKMFTFQGYDGKLIRSVLTYTPLVSGNGLLICNGSDGASSCTLKMFSFSTPGTLLGEADGLLGEADELLGDEGEVPGIERAFQIARDAGIYLQWQTTSGRIQVDRLDAEFAAPIGR